MAAQAIGNKHLEYFNVYVTFQRFGNSSRSENFDENMLDFDEVVNEKLQEGWQLLGPPTFSLGWCDMQSGGIAIQTLIREKNVETAVVVDVNPEVLVAECVKPVRSSRRLANSNI
jgi:hypothetical protein